VVVIPIAVPAARFIETLIAGASLGEALAVCAPEEGFDPAAALGALLALKAIIAIGEGDSDHV